MPKLNYKVACRKLVADVPFPADLAHLAWRPAMAGAESSVGLIPVMDDHQALRWNSSGGFVLQVRVEKRKPPEAIVNGMATRRIRACKEQLTKEQSQAIYDQVKAELWNSTPSKITDVFVHIRGRMVYLYANGATADKIVSYLRTSFGTFPVERMWDGAAFSDMIIDHLLNDVDLERAALDDCISFTRHLDHSTVSITDAPDVYAVAFSKIMATADTVHSVGMIPESIAEFVTVAANGAIQGTTEVMKERDDSTFADFLIYDSLARAVADDVVQMSAPYIKHEEVEEDESED